MLPNAKPEIQIRTLPGNLACLRIRPVSALRSAQAQTSQHAGMAGPEVISRLFDGGLKEKGGEAVTQQITYDIERDLDVPPGLPVEAYLEVTIEPPDAGALIYGYTSEDTLTAFEVRGGISRVDLPIVNPRIYVKYLRGLKTFSFRQLGFRDMTLGR